MKGKGKKRKERKGKGMKGKETKGKRKRIENKEDTGRKS